MKKIFLLLGIILMNGMLFSCSNDNDLEDLRAYQQDVEIYNTGGEDEQIPPPPPPPGGN